MKNQKKIAELGITPLTELEAQHIKAGKSDSIIVEDQILGYIIIEDEIVL